MALGTVAISACGQPALTCTLQSAAKQGFSGFSGNGARMMPLGRIDNGKAAFKFYFYEFINPESRHANHRLLVFSDACRYLGSYAVDAKPVGIEEDRIVFPDTGTPGNVAKFEGASPPDRIWIDGDLPRLER